MSRKKNSRVGDLFLPIDGGGLNLDLRRRLSESEISEAAELTELLNNFCLSDLKDDRVWGDGSRGFSAKATALSLLSRYKELQPTGTPFPSHRVWCAYLSPPKVAFSVWTLINGRILTVDKLKKGEYSS